MAQGSTLWQALQGLRKQREQEMRQAQERHPRLIREAQRAYGRAVKKGEHAAGAERKQYEQQAHEARAAEAAALTGQTEAQVEMLRTLLTSSKYMAQNIAFTTLKRQSERSPFVPSPQVQAVPPPRWEDFEPRAPGVLVSALGGQARYARRREAAWQRFQEALISHGHAEEDRQRELARMRKAHDQRMAVDEAEIRAFNEAVDQFEADFRGGVPEAVEEYYTHLLKQSVYPQDFPQHYRVAYRPEPRELVVEYRLPGKDVVPPVRGYRYVKIRREIDELSRPEKEMKELYNLVISQVALRTMHECFTTGSRGVVDSVVFNGIAAGRERATGKAVEHCVISTGASRTDFEDLELAHLDPAACLKRLKAIISPHPYDLAPVEPVIEFDKAKYRFTDPIDALADLDSRPDLLKMDWYRFENLIRQLFEAMGMEVEITQSSRDEGIDCVAYDKTNVIRRAEYVIQAKRYSRIVPAESVRALAASVEEKRATCGFLVTTSWFGAASRTFAKNNNRLQLIDGGELKHLLAEHLGRDVRIDLGRTTPKGT